MSVEQVKPQIEYNEDNIRSLDWKEHIRMRPGMYNGKLGDGASADDGIYILIKEDVDMSTCLTMITAFLTLTFSLHVCNANFHQHLKIVEIRSFINVFQHYH